MFKLELRAGAMKQTTHKSVRNQGYLFLLQMCADEMKLNEKYIAHGFEANHQQLVNAH